MQSHRAIDQTGLYLQGRPASASQPRNPGFPATQGHGRAWRSAGRPGRGGLLIGTFSERSFFLAHVAGLLLLLAACSGGGGNPAAPLQPPAPTTGGLEVTTATSGTDLDPDGYEIAIDGTTVGSIGLNEVRAFDQVAVGEHQVQLRGVTSNCIVSDNPRSVGVQGSGMARITFQIGCTKIPTLSFAAIAGKWSGIMTEIQPCCVFVYRLTYVLENEAPFGGRVGTYTVTEIDPFKAEGNLVARRASGNQYEVDEKVTSATGWIDASGIKLTHDPNAETLTYKWNNPLRPGFGTTGTLERVE